MGTVYLIAGTLTWKLLLILAAVTCGWWLRSLVLRHRKTSP